MTVDEAMQELQGWLGFPDDCATFTFALSILQDLWETAKEVNVDSHSNDDI